MASIIDSISKSHITNKSPMKNSLCPDKDVNIQDKYELDLRFRSQHRQKVASAKNCDTFKLWDLHNKDIPLHNQLLPDVDLPAAKNQSIWDDHADVASTRTYNFMKAQIPVQSQLKIDSWEKHLKEYWDKQLTFLIKYGSPLDFDSSITLNHEIKNHKSATVDHITDQIKKLGKGCKIFKIEYLEHSGMSRSIRVATILLDYTTIPTLLIPV